MTNRRRRTATAALAALMAVTCAVVAPARVSAAPATAAIQSAADAYVFGAAPVAMVRTRSQLLCPRGPLRPAPNQLVNVPIAANPLIRAVVAPNSDTLYTTAFLDLRDGPVTLSYQNTGGRYLALQMLDMYTDVIGNIGTRTTGSGPASVTVVPPGYTGQIPAGSQRMQSTTWDVWLLGRVLIAGGGSPIAQQVQAGIGLSVGPRQGYPAAVPPRLRTPACTGRSPQDLAADGPIFFDELADVLAANPPPARDAAAVAAMAAVGVRPGSTPSRGPTAELLSSAIPVGERTIDAAVAGNLARRGSWSSLATAGHYGSDYVTRAVVATWGLGANEEAESRYFLADSDSGGARLDGSRTYRLHLPARRPLVPVDPSRGGWWSVTMYDEANFLVPNLIGRYSLGPESSALTRNPDGSVDIVLSSRPPGDPRLLPNWLPAPAGTFRLIFRQYVPTSTTWFPWSPQVSGH
ncbi:DUF1254 domain-containing protein [Gordonia sp. PKS22-38]|uniref:DUF1254 domain-containing protein n=1 Tax=Gordonia prachuapensis TaxID=3115651 RepID=A0ABU7MP06_9ACTN|nr:DUF1254 domain-containing protein [Gordonia sp. PKS22-38]